MPSVAHASQRNLGVVLALGSMSSVQLGAALSQPLFHRLGVAGVVLLRVFFAAVALGLFVHPRLRGRGRELLLPAVLGVVSGLNMLAFFAAISRIPLGITVAIEFIGPLCVALTASRRWVDALWVLLAATGIVLLTAGHPIRGHLDGLGVLLAFSAAAGWAAYIVLINRLGRVWPGFGGLVVSVSVAAVAVLPFAVAHFARRFGDGGDDLAGLALGVLIPLAPFVLEMASLRRLPTRVFGVLMSIEPGLGALFGFVLLGQSLATAGVLAILLIITASLGATLTSSGATAVPRD